MEWPPGSLRFPSLYTEANLKSPRGPDERFAGLSWRIYSAAFPTENRGNAVFRFCAKFCAEY